MTPEQRAKLTPVQRAALDKADRTIDHAMQLYHWRNYVSFRVCGLARPDLQRLSDNLRKLSDAEFLQVVEYVEGLAMWSTPDSESGDATGAQQGTEQAGPAARAG